MATLTLAYSQTVKTRYFYVGPTRRDYAEVLRAMLYAYFDDTAGLVVTVTSNNGRLVGAVTFSQERQSGMAADNTIRHAIALTQMEGLDGQFFDVQTVKTIPSDGDYEYEGVQLDVDPTEREDEYADGSAALTGMTTFVVEADAGSGEDDAYD